jgi:hypothetical protein
MRIIGTKNYKPTCIKRLESLKCLTHTPELCISESTLKKTQVIAVN